MLEITRTLINEYPLPHILWAEAFNTACYIVNRVNIRPHQNKTHYELWKGHKLNVSYFKAFGSKCFILDESQKLAKFDLKAIEGIFVGYSDTTKAFRVYIPQHRIVIESVHVKFNENANKLTEKSKDFIGIEDQPYLFLKNNPKL